MQDRYEHQQDEYYRALKEKRTKKKKAISDLMKSFLLLLIGNAFPFAIYFIFLSKLVSEKNADGDAVAGLVCTFGIIAQIVMLIVVSVLNASKNEDEHRALLHASREDTFSRGAYYLASWKRLIWMMPVAYLIMQFPFMIYYTLFGYYYQAETVFAHFYIPQLTLCEVTKNGFLGCILNTLILAVIYGVCVFVMQKIWLRERIRT